MKKRICLLMAIALLLTGCGGSAVAETQASATETMVTTEPTTEPTTLPTEPKTFFEEQGFEFWEGFEVHNTLDDEGNLDGGIIAFGNILDSTECTVTITCGNREETTYCLADTKVDVLMDEYTLAEFDETCKHLRTENIKNASDSFYKVFKEEDSGLTKEAWLEQYQDYKVIHYQLNRQIKLSEEVEKAKIEMNIGQSQFSWNHSCIWAKTMLLNNKDGNLYTPWKLGAVGKFLIETNDGNKIFAVIEDQWQEKRAAGIAEDFYIWENIFVMLPSNVDGLTFVSSLFERVRTLDDYEKTYEETKETSESGWEKMEYEKFYGNHRYLKPYFFSYSHH